MRRIAATLLFLALIIGLLSLLPQPVRPLAEATEVRMLSWNIESGGNDPDVIAEQLQELASKITRPGCNCSRWPTTWVTSYGGWRCRAMSNTGR
jgi:hypothetical protein